MKYTEISIWTSSEAVEAVTEWLRLQGIEGVTIEDRQDFLKQYPDRFGEIYSLQESDFPEMGAKITAYHADVPHDLTCETVLEAVQGLRQYEIDPGDVKVRFALVDDEEWADQWKRYYHVTPISNRLTIVPSWEEYIPTGDEQIIRLDPGMAFGTGTHPTTVLILKLMEEYLKAGDRVIDVGCGSGILSIAAAKLGASSVSALDLDPVAVQVTEENCELNDVDQTVEVRQNNLLQGIRVDTPQMIVSNILADILLRIFDDAFQLLPKDGVLLLSGIINQRVEDVCTALCASGFTIEKQLQEQDWNAIAARK